MQNELESNTVVQGVLRAGNSWYSCDETSKIVIVTTDPTIAVYSEPG